MEIEEDNDAWCFLAHPFSLSPTTVAAATGVRCTTSPAEGTTAQALQICRLRAPMAYSADVSTACAVPRRGKPRRMEELRSCRSPSAMQNVKREPKYDFNCLQKGFLISKNVLFFSQKKTIFSVDFTFDWQVLDDGI
jgi:hypothetical protein